MLTSEQLVILRSDIEGDVTLSAIPNTPDGAFTIADIYNQLASPTFYLWKSHVSTYDIRSALIWNEYDTLSVSKQNAFQFLCSNGIVDARLTNVRQGIASIFSGPGQAGNFSALTIIAKRTATRIEKLLATGTGTEQSPASSSFPDGFLLTYQDVLSARNLS